MLIILTFIIELILAGATTIWLIAMLGFADEAHRSHKAGFAGRVAASLCVGMALAPPLATLWVIWKYYFSGSPFQSNVLALGLPVAAMLVAALVCAVLIYFYRRSYRTR